MSNFSEIDENTKFRFLPQDHYNLDTLVQYSDNLEKFQCCSIYKTFCELENTKCEIVECTVLECPDNPKLIGSKINLKFSKKSLQKIYNICEGENYVR